MYKLIKPHRQYEQDFRRMCRECLTAAKPDYGDWDADFAGYLTNGVLDDFEKNVVQPLLDVETGPLAQFWHVPTAQWWLVDDQNHFMGFTDIRYQLIDCNKGWGGHMGLFLRPSARGKGIGKQLLRLALDKAHFLNLPRICICCNQKNIPMNKIILSILSEYGGVQMENGSYKGDPTNCYMLNTHVSFHPVKISPLSE